MRFANVLLPVPFSPTKTSLLSWSGTSIVLRPCNPTTRKRLRGADTGVRSALVACGPEGSTKAPGIRLHDANAGTQVGQTSESLGYVSRGDPIVKVPRTA